MWNVKGGQRPPKGPGRNSPEALDLRDVHGSANPQFFWRARHAPPTGKVDNKSVQAAEDKDYLFEAVLLQVNNLDKLKDKIDIGNNMNNIKTTMLLKNK